LEDWDPDQASPEKLLALLALLVLGYFVYLLVYVR